MKRLCVTALLLAIVSGCGGNQIEYPTGDIVPTDPPKPAKKGLPDAPAGGAKQLDEGAKPGTE
jgi:hypothetical protein